jgi:hypothetical protein
MKAAAWRGRMAAAAVVIVGCAVSGAIGCTSGVVGGEIPGVAGSAGEAGAAGESGSGGGAGAAGDTSEGDAGTPNGGDPDSGAPDGVSVTPTNANCLQIRMCVAACMDAACADRCVALGSPAGRALFDQLQMCSRTACPDQTDRTCRCEAECIFPGTCADLQNMCADGVTDPACQMCA